MMGYVQSHRKIVPMMRSCAILLLLCVPHVARANDEPTAAIESDELMKTSDLEQAETKDASATEIIKQIRKLNPDGTFTIGFEADDGSFKIETRDLQGNVKQGTYGYIDERGEVKRVSYSTQNSTLFKEYQATTPSRATTKDSDDDSSDDSDNNETISPAPSSRYNRTFASTTRRPSALAFLTSTHGPTTSKSNVVQVVPKRRIALSDRSSTQIASSSSSTDTSRQPIEGTTTVVYATSVPTPKPYSSRSTTSPNYSLHGGARKGVEIDQVERKVFISTSKDVTTMKPTVLGKHDKGDDKVDLTKRGNALRRQLKPDDEAIEAQQQRLYGDGDESSGTYGSNYGNLRPLFSTTAQPKIPLQVLAARQRATQLQSVLANSSPGTTTTTERVYTKAPKRQSKVKVDEVSEIASENFITQPPGLDQISATEQSENDERRAYGRPLPPHLEGLYRPRNYLRQLQPQPQNIQEDIRQPQFPPRFGQQQQQLQQQQQHLQPVPSNNYAEQQQQQAVEGYANAPLPFFPQQRNPYDYDRPLTVRDFERLLQVLVLRQQQSFPRANPFYPSSNPLAYAPFIPSYNQPNPYSNQIPRPPYFNPLATGLYDPGYQNPYYSPSMPVSQHINNDPMLQGGASAPPFNPQQQQQQQPQDLGQDIQQRFSRRRQYNSRFFSPQQQQQQQQQTQVPSPPIAPSEQELNYNSLQGPVIDTNYIPPSVREQLLYRMLILALRPDGGPQSGAPPPLPPNFQSPQQLTQSASSLHTVLEPEQQETSTIIKSIADNSSKKPVRSVQILGEEESE